MKKMVKVTLFAIVVAVCVTVVSSCRKNSDCSSHWCEGGGFWRSGRCIRKRGDTEHCYNGDGNSCHAGQCTCGRCGRRLPGGYSCSTNYNCRSGWCDGSWTAGCRGTCRSKGHDGQGCSDNNFCHSGQCTCGKCGRHLASSSRCATNYNCRSGWCERPAWKFGCSGTCMRKRGNGERCYNKDSKSCVSDQCTCGSCGRHLPDGYSCSTNDNCKSGYCHSKFITAGCNGKCQPAYFRTAPTCEYKSDIEYSRWMDKIPDDTRLMDMSLPGTHDTMARYDADSADYAKTQSMPLRMQLLQGIRVLDIRCRNVGDKFDIYHGSVYQNAEFGKDVLKVCIDFLATHYSEAIILNVQQEGDAINPQTTFLERFKRYVDHYGKQHFYNVHTKGSTLSPTRMRDIRGKIVMNTNNGYKFYKGKSESVRTVIQDEYKLCKDNKHRHVMSNYKEALRTPFSSDMTFVNKLSATCPPFYSMAAIDHWFTTPLGQAKYENEKSGKYLEEVLSRKSELKDKFRVGIIEMDFPGGKLIDAVIRINNLQ